MWHNKSLFLFYALLVSVLTACTSRTPAPDIDATVQAALHGTQTADARVAAAVAATVSAQQTQVAAITSAALNAATPTGTATMTVDVTSTPTAAIADVPESAPASPTTAPPTPSPTLAPPSPTPTPAIADVAESDADGNDGNPFLRGSSQSNGGKVILLPTFKQSEVDGLMTFRDHIVYRAEVFNTKAGEPFTDGKGIDRVVFTISDDNGHDVYKRTERQAGFCVFGGGEPTCNVVTIGPGPSNWPPADGGQTEIGGGRICNGFYQTTVDIFAKDGQFDQWRWSFAIDSPAAICDEANLPDLFANIERGEGDDQPQLSIRVEAFDPTVGSNDGDGIATVVIQIFDPNGVEVHRQREENAAYCAFGGSAPCEPWRFGERDNQWPNGDFIQSGAYLIRATVNAQSGRSQTVEQTFQIQAP
ncbi:MAG: hypothetical protein R3A44_43810 [Caldilineaceae bacterium]